VTRAKKETISEKSEGLEPSRRSGLVRAFLAWYDREARDLPWRRTRDPYAIWLSEVMLQQTRVDTVIPYWHRFLADFPTVDALAEAPLDAVLLRWSGLGYYRRARQLHLAAKEVVARYGGVFPRTAGELASLSGVGAYTAGAIASIAFDEPAPLVDGNVVRVLSRIEAIEDDMRSAKGQKRVWALAGELVPQARAGEFNQSLMELGSQVCTPKTPRCERCPVRRFCRAAATETAELLPVLRAKKAPRAESLVAAVVRSGDGIVLGQRRDDGLYGGMWEPPTSADLAGTLNALVASGLPKTLELNVCGNLRHVLSHKRLSVEVAGAEVARPPKPRALRVAGDFVSTYQRLEVRRPDEVALSTLARKVLKVAGVALALSSVLVARDARADGDEVTTADLERYRAFSESTGNYGRVFATAAGGRGLRFNNPFRLGTPLGKTVESVSATSPYVDVGLGVGLGDPHGLQHGPHVHASFALDGVSQSSLTASYMLLRRGASPLLTYGRAGAALLTSPDPNVGAEVAFGIGAFLTGAVGATAEVVGNLFYGAGTYDTVYTVVPVVSLQLGLVVDLEVLP